MLFYFLNITLLFFFFIGLITFVKFHIFNISYFFILRGIITCTWFVTREIIYILDIINIQSIYDYSLWIKGSFSMIEYYINWIDIRPPFKPSVHQLHYYLHEYISKYPSVLKDGKLPVSDIEYLRLNTLFQRNEVEKNSFFIISVVTLYLIFFFF